MRSGDSACARCALLAVEYMLLLQTAGHQKKKLFGHYIRYAQHRVLCSMFYDSSLTSPEGSPHVNA